jgi:hypothetical protein
MLQILASRKKLHYAAGVAGWIEHGAFDREAMASMPDDRPGRCMVVAGGAWALHTQVRTDQVTPPWQMKRFRMEPIAITVISRHRGRGLPRQSC